MSLHAVLNNPLNRDNNILVSPRLYDCSRTLENNAIYEKKGITTKFA